MSSIAGRLSSRHCQPVPNKQHLPDDRSEWLGRKLVQALDAAGMTRAQLVRRLHDRGMKITRAGVYDWCATGRIDKRHLPEVARILGLRVDYFLSPTADPEPLLEEEDVSPEESNLVLAFRDLLPEQQRKILAEVQAKATENRAIHERFASRYGKAVSDAKVAEHIAPAPKTPSKTKRR
jgi:hypothetical protein